MFTTAIPLLLAVVLAAGCGSENTATPATVTVSTTVTDIKTVAEVQTATVAPPAEVKTVTTVVTQTVTPATATVTVTADESSSGAGTLLTFDSAKVAAGVKRLLIGAPPAGYGITGVTDTSCPNDRPVEAGTTFLCHATIDNASKSIKITVVTDAGKYQVGMPQ